MCIAWIYRFLPNYRFEILKIDFEMECWRKQNILGVHLKLTLLWSKVCGVINSAFPVPLQGVFRTKTLQNWLVRVAFKPADNIFQVAKMPP